MIVTGAPIEHLPFDQVMYWGELRDFLDEVSSGLRATISNFMVIFHPFWGA